MIVYIGIGNSDDKLTQARWAEFVSEVSGVVQRTGAYPGAAVHGEWRSLPDAPWQNACWCLQLPDEGAVTLRTILSRLAGSYEQDSIAWAVAPTTQFIAPQ